MPNPLYSIALAMTPGLGCRSCRQLLEIYRDPEEIFNMDHRTLKEIFGTHDTIIESIYAKTMLPRAEEELNWTEKHKIKVLFCTDPDYPQRLNRSDCPDTPVTLYMKGDCDLNQKRIISIVGTRRATEYGKDMTARLVAQLKGEDILIVSGLAYGIDGASHRAALANTLPTVGVLGHGLDQIYPSQHRTLAKEMIYHDGALLTEYPSQTKINPGYFPARNRIIAALSDATLVIEAAEKGGALITAGIAGSYHRDVFAVPGRVFDSYSKGCNNLIACNRANILRSMDDLFYMLGWEKKNADTKTHANTQQELFTNLNADEQAIYNLLHDTPNLTMQEIAEKTNISLPKIANALLNMELNNQIKCLPGKIYKCC